MKRSGLTGRIRKESHRRFLASPRDSGRSAADNLRFLAAVFWIAALAPWRDLSERLSWNSLFRRSTVKGVFECVFKGLSGDKDFEYAIIDRTIVRVR